MDRGLILVADDDPNVRVIPELALTRLGFRVLPATDGREAVDLFERHVLDVILTLTDFSMPHLTGDRVFREIRRIQPTALVVLTTGTNAGGLAKQLEAEGLAGFVPKPFGVSGLLNTVWSVLQRGEAEGSVWCDPTGCWRRSGFDAGAWQPGMMM